MDFGGDLSILEPTMIFQIANISRLSGVMKLITVDNVARFYFREGELLYATIETRKKRIGEFLIDKGFINREQLDEALEEYRSKRANKKIGQILIDRGYLDYDSLTSAIQDQMKEVVYEVLQWKSGQFIFFNKVKPEDEGIILDIKMDHLILEGLKRLDEARGD
jgi:predicted nucleic acid-binding OB-fold protein